MSVLVIVPCGVSKIWDQEPQRGAVPACDAYTGNPFRLNRQYAERFGDAWMVLSAKYGFIAPDFLIPGPYEVTFKRRATHPITVDALRAQVQDHRLDRFEVVVGLGGKEYRSAIQETFAGASVSLQFPFAGLPIGKMMRATKQAISRGHAGAEREAHHG